MSRKINTTSIGLFIVAGLALGVAGLLLFSSSKFFANTRDVIVYFDDSLNGLSEGAPVKYRGVTIGSVKRVMVRFNQAEDDYAMPVILELEEKLLLERVGEPMDMFTEKALEERIKKGLRASLQTESLVTGVLYVEIHPTPDPPPAVLHQLKKVYPEVPSESTQIQQIFKHLATLDIKSIETNVNSLLTKLDTTLNRLDVGQINQGFTNLLLSLNHLAASPDLTNGLAALRPTLDQYRILGEKLNSRVDPLADSLTNSLAEANRALQQVRAAADNLRSLTSPNSPLRGNLDQALEEFAAAAQSISSLVDFLKQHPNALITGRENTKKLP